MAPKVRRTIEIIAEFLELRPGENSPTRILNIGYKKNAGELFHRRFAQKTSVCYFVFKIASFAALATRNFTTVFAGI